MSLPHWAPGFLLESLSLEEEEADFSLPSWEWGIADLASLPTDEQQLLRAEQGPGGRGYSPGVCLLSLPPGLGPPR